MAFSSLFILISNFHLSILPFVESLRCSAPLLPSWGRHWCTCCLRPRQQRRRHWRLVLPATSRQSSYIFHQIYSIQLMTQWFNTTGATQTTKPTIAHSSKRSSQGSWILRHPIFQQWLILWMGWMDKIEHQLGSSKHGNFIEYSPYQLLICFVSIENTIESHEQWYTEWLRGDPSNGFLQSPCNWIP